jgi:predicted transposase/invertase (TIGR01784 family)
LRRRQDLRLDFTTLERANGAFVTRKLRSRETDLVWRLRTNAGRLVYVYLLLELQSTVDRYMAVRLMGYTALLYQDVIAGRIVAAGGKLPLVVPIVLYNGEGRWWAARDIGELIETTVDPDDLRLRPAFKYRLIDQGSYDVQELASRDNLAALLFWLEKTPEPADLQRGVARLVEALSGPDDGELRSAFAAWLQIVRLPGKGLTEEDIPEVLGLEEFRTMLEKRVEEWSQTLLERGRQEGRREGRHEGEKRGEAKVLLHLLEVKFGAVDDRTRSRVQAAGPKRLLQWAERVVTADTLSDVFAR